MAKPPSSSSSSFISLRVSARRTGYFKCNTCSTDVGSNENSCYSITPTGNFGWSFPSLVNVELIERIYVLNRVQVEAHIHCKGCNNHIGWKLGANQRNARILVLEWARIEMQPATSYI